MIISHLQIISPYFTLHKKLTPQNLQGEKCFLYITRFFRGFASNKIGMFLLQILNETD